MLLPPLVSDTEVTLVMDHGEHLFFEGVTTPTMGCNGPVLAPVLEVHQGDVVSWNVTNNIDEMTTMHWHGMHVAPENDGGPHSVIAPGETWSPSFEVLDEAGTYWYHPHLHMMTNKHVSLGVSGMIWVRDVQEQALGLPRTYGVDEFPVIIQTKAFDEEGNIVPDSNTDDVAMVNATVDATLDVPAQVLRFHMLNGSSQRVFNLGLEGDMTFHMMATEGGLLPNPVTLSRIRLAPGERCELLVDATGLEGSTLRWMSFASELSNGFYGATYPGMGAGMSMDGYNPNPLNGADFSLLEMNVGATTENAVTTIPAALDDTNGMPWSTTDIDTYRTVTMSPVQMGPNQLNGAFLLNGAPFNMDVINYTIPLNNLEAWTISNNSGIAHPFHIHDVQFYILNRNGIPVGPEESGRKDVVLVPPMSTATFMAKFEDFANPDIPYMYHCHMLTHEDGGMMGQFVVVDPSNVEETKNPSIVVQPNPASNAIQATGVEGAWNILDLSGKVVASGTSIAQPTTVDVASWPNGMYLLRDESRRTSTFVIQH
ncbi:MAG: hypothetical protein RLZZ314_1357 [Bacteroidota bacterium]|jgi:blue copper oxidase